MSGCDQYMVYTSPEQKDLSNFCYSVVIIKCVGVKCARSSSEYYNKAIIIISYTYINYIKHYYTSSKKANIISWVFMRRKTWVPWFHFENKSRLSMENVLLYVCTAQCTSYITYMNTKTISKLRVYLTQNRVLNFKLELQFLWKITW